MSRQEIDALIPRRYRHLFDDAFVEAHQAIELYTRACVRRIVDSLIGGADPLSRAELLARARATASAVPLVDWMLAWLTALGDLESSGVIRRVEGRPDLPDAATLRDRAVAARPAVGPTYALVGRCAAFATEFISGGLTGDDVLFPRGSHALWLEYFDNDNPLYAVNNLLAAQVLAEELEAIGGSRVIEFGGGGGSAALALARWATEHGQVTPCDYTLTEPAADLRGYAEGRLRAQLPGRWRLQCRAADLGRSLVAQGFGAGAYDAAWAVNTFHALSDPEEALARARPLLRPGGVLVIGECVRPRPAEAVYIEFVFNFLGSYRGVQTGPVRRRYGFLAPEEWFRILLAAGFRDVRLMPDITRLRQAYSKANVAALVASVA